MLTVASVSKSYGSLQALKDVSATFAEGEIHAVLGENGAGKSTLMHVLAGFTLPDAGSLSLDGQAIPLGRPFECKRRGIAMIHQHFTLVPGFTVEENLALAHLPRLGGVDISDLAAPAVSLAKELGWALDLKARAGSLPVGAQQRIEIVKSLAGEGRVAIFDEPTAVLGPGEVDELFRVLRRLKDGGKIVILIAHKLSEVMEISDRVTVLRRGQVVADAQTTAVTATQLAEWMVGEMPPPLQTASRPASDSMLVLKQVTARGDRGEPALRGITLDVRGGEVLGIGGVDGNGQVELAEVLVGIRPFDGSRSLENGRTAFTAYIPQDRQTDGLALGMTIEENLLIRTPHTLSCGPFLRRRAVRAWADGLIKRFDIRARSRVDTVASLSGGNQQKVVVARALDEVPELLVAVNPTRGLDVKAADFVHRQILAARDAGAIVVLISTDLDELAALSTRTMYLSRGQLAQGDDAQAMVGG